MERNELDFEKGFDDELALTTESLLLLFEERKFSEIRERAEKMLAPDLAELFDGIETSYYALFFSLLSKELAADITQGAKVVAGQRLGKVGSTALIESAEEAHLHFEMTYNGEIVDPLAYITE